MKHRAYQSALAALFLLSSCRSIESDKALQARAIEMTPSPVQLADAVPLPPPEPECINLPSCPADEPNDPYQCTLYRYAGKILWESQRLQAWGPTPCLAARALNDLACKEKLDGKQIGDIGCSPDPSGGRCPVPVTSCPESIKPSRCTARNYEQNELAWDQRPTAWARNECEARNKLNTIACQQGLNPESLTKIECEADVNPGLCPPPLPTCSIEHKEPTECLVSQIGDISLKKPWIAIGTSLCEAQYRLQFMACLFANSLNQLTPQKLGSMECRSLVVTAPPPQKEATPPANVP